MTTTQHDPTSTTLEEVKTILRQLAERQKETERLRQENDEKFDRQLRETTRVLRENDAEIDRQLKENALQMKETDRRLRRAEDLFTTQWGRLVESLVEGNLAELLEERGVKIETVVTRIPLRSDPAGREVDLLAINGEEVVAVEVKITLRPPDVDKFLRLLVDLPTVLPRQMRADRVYGGVAYLRQHEGTARYAERKGLFVIRATGNSASIVNPPEFRPRAFHAPAG